MAATVQLPIVSSLVEPVALHLLIVITDIAQFTADIADTENALYVSFNAGNNQASLWSLDAVGAQIVGISQVDNDNYDVMALIWDSDDVRITDQVLLQTLETRGTSRLSSSLGHTVKALSKEPFGLPDDANESSGTSENDIWIGLAVAGGVLAGVMFLVCCAQCCYYHCCGERRLVHSDPRSFDASEMYIDLEKGDVRNRRVLAHESFMSTASNKPLVDDGIYSANGEFTFYPGEKEEAEFDQYPIDELDYPEDPNPQPVPTHSMAIDLTPDTLFSFSSPAVDAQQTCTFPRIKKFTLYEKSIIHAAALPPLFFEANQKGKLRKRASSLTDLADAVSEKIRTPFVYYNEGYADDSGVGSMAPADGAPTFEESFAALQKLEGRGNSSARTLPSRMRIESVNYNKGRGRVLVRPAQIHHPQSRLESMLNFFK